MKIHIAHDDDDDVIKFKVHVCPMVYKAVHESIHRSQTHGIHIPSDHLSQVVNGSTKIVEHQCRAWSKSHVVECPVEDDMSEVRKDE